MAANAWRCGRGSLSSLHRSRSAPGPAIPPSANCRLATSPLVGTAPSWCCGARGDFCREHSTAEIPTYRSHDEIGQTADVVRAIISKSQTAILAYEQARAELSGLIGQVARSSDQVTTGAG